jgi:hypothetical protein
VREPYAGVLDVLRAGSQQQQLLLLTLQQEQQQYSTGANSAASTALAATAGPPVLSSSSSSSSPLVPPVVSVDVPSGWDVDAADPAAHAGRLQPDMLVSLSGKGRGGGATQARGWGLLVPPSSVTLSALPRPLLSLHSPQTLRRCLCWPASLPRRQVHPSSTGGPVWAC